MKTQERFFDILTYLKKEYETVFLNLFEGTWQEAVEKCTQMDARLILPENFEIQDFLVSLLFKNSEIK